ncbi:phytase [uncultured Friedmanniella sp.]|uniref:phytase n=1 Tax=uncultured Friedmanniella sp. TaxID=335381 RepID=UPI0035CBC4B5
MNRLLPVGPLLSGALAVVTCAAVALTPAPALAAGTSTGHRAEPDSLVQVTARVETPPVFDDEAGGNGDADDPAIWVNRRDRSRSVVIGTVKNAGLQVFDLRGRLVQTVAPPAAPAADDEPGRFNNVDIVPGFRLGARRVDLAVVSDRGRDQIRAYAIDARTGRLSDVTAADVPLAFSADQTQVNDQQTVYGLTTYVDPDGTAYAVGTRRHTPQIGLFRLVAEHGRVSYRRVDTADFPTSFRLRDGRSWSPCEDPGEGPQLEGLVVDEANHTLYAAQEDVALWRLKLGRGRFGTEPRIVERTQEFGVPAAYDPKTEECAVTGADPGYGGRIAADVEGLTIYATGRRSGTLLVSSQGDNTFYTYDRRTLAPLRHFAVVDGRRTDGSSDCDGADTVSTPLPGYPHGLLVVQDGDNTPDVVDGDGEPRTVTDFKFVSAQVLRHR